MEKSKNKFHMRGFTSFVTFWTFLILSFSGILLYFTPRGKTANWANWTMLGLTKEGWAGLHILLSLLFLLSIILHIYFNWKVLIHYFVNKAKTSMRLKKELALSIVFTGVFFFSAVFEVQPLWSFMNWNTDIKDYWENKGLNPPVPHAEEMTLGEIAEMREENVDDLLRKLKNNDIKVTDEKMTLKDIAEDNDSTPNDVYALFNRGTGKSASGGAGFGYGKMNIKELCDAKAVNLKSALEKLKANNIDASAEDNLRTLAEKHGKNPHDLIDIIEGK